MKHNKTVDAQKALDALESLADRFDFEDERQAGINYREVKSFLKAAALQTPAPELQHKEPTQSYHDPQVITAWFNEDGTFEATPTKAPGMMELRNLCWFFTRQPEVE